MLRSLMAKLKLLKLYVNTLAATAATASVDTAGFGSLCLVVISGAFSYTGSNKVSLTVQHCDDNATWVDAEATDIYNPESGAIAKILDATADGDASHAIHYLGEKRYVRLNMVVAGTVSAIIAVEAIEGHPQQLPPA